MVLCGHADADDVVVSKQIGDYGNEVTQILIDPQTMDAEYGQGSKGMVAMLYFSEDGEDVQVEYYSTLKDTYRPSESFTVTYGSTEMPSYDGIADNYVIAQNKTTGLYTYVENDYFTFMGGSLRYVGTVDGYANIRFGYKFKTSVDLSLTEWGWKYGVEGTGLRNVKEGTNYNSKNVTNLVITNVPSSYYKTNLECQLFFEVVIDGETYVIYDRVRARNIYGIAENMVKNPTEAQGAKDYAQTIIDSCAS